MKRLVCKKAEALLLWQSAQAGQTVGADLDMLVEASYGRLAQSNCSIATSQITPIVMWAATGVQSGPDPCICS